MKISVLEHVMTDNSSVFDVAIVDNDNKNAMIILPALTRKDAVLLAEKISEAMISHALVKVDLEI